MQRKRFSVALIAAAIGSLFAGGVSVAFAQLTPQAADMSVTGTIVPAACSAAFTGGGEVDFGTIRLIDLPANAYSSLGSKDITLSVNCSSNKYVTFSVADLQSASRVADAAMYTALATSADPTTVYGLGTGVVDSTTVNLGGYSILSGQPRSNGTAGPIRFSTNAGSTWRTDWTSAILTLSSDGRLFAAFSSAGARTSATSFEFPLTIRAALNYGSRLQVAQDTRLNGQAVFSINYQ